MMLSRVMAGVVVVAVGHAQEPGVKLFREHVRQAFEKNCLFCHDSQMRKSGLDLSTRESLLRGGDKGPAIVSGNAKDSLLQKLIAHQQEPAMPYQGKKLPEEAL